MDQLAEGLQEALTVTSDKLKAITQGRRYNKPPSQLAKVRPARTSLQTRAEIVAESATRGHWHKECPNNKGNGKGGKSSGQRTVHVAEELVEEEENQHDSFFVYMVSREEPGKTIYRAPEVCLASAKSSGGYMITDTACQRLCHGKGWFEQHEGLLFQNLGLRVAHWGTRDIQVRRWEAASIYLAGEDPCRAWWTKCCPVFLTVRPRNTLARKSDLAGLPRSHNLPSERH